METGSGLRQPVVMHNLISESLIPGYNNKSLMRIASIFIIGYPNLKAFLQRPFINGIKNISLVIIQHRLLIMLMKAS